MQAIQQLTEKIQTGAHLDAEDASSAAALLAAPEVAVDAKRAFLLALAMKGETAVEVAAFAQKFRDYAVDPGVGSWADRAIDVCGTGGDGSGTFNISTAVSFIVASAGVPVFKHGNRSITSKCGSADLLEALGFELEASSTKIRESLDTLNFRFFFAPAFHPAFKEIMPVRKALAAEGKRTIFNLLGPLINPGRPAHQLLGVYAVEWVDRLADALGAMQLRGGMVVHGVPEPGRALDELSCAGENRVAGFGEMAELPAQLTAAEAGLPACSFEELEGGSIEVNLATMEGLLAGRADAVPRGLRNSVLLNAGAALQIVGQADDLQAGVALASEFLSSGTTRDWLARAREFYQKAG